MNNYFMYGNKKIASGTKIIFNEEFCNKNLYAFKDKNSSVFRGVTHCIDGNKVWYFDNRCFKNFVPGRDIKGIEMNMCNNCNCNTKPMSVNETLDVIFPQLMTYIFIMMFFSITKYRIPMWILITFIFLYNTTKKIYF